MPNPLDENDQSLINHSGKDIHVINKQLKAQVGFGSLIFELTIWLTGLFPVGIFFLVENRFPVTLTVHSYLFEICLWLFVLVPGIILLWKKVKARSYFDALMQRIQHNASQIDNYLEQRVQIMNNAVGIIERAIDLDKDVMKSVAEVRSGNVGSTSDKADVNSKLDSVMSKVNVAFESYPELKAHSSLADAMQQNSYLQKEITAAREMYNDNVLKWNADIFDWPIKNIVASKSGFETKIPFTASKETKQRATERFF